MALIAFGDIKEENGKTIRENNLERSHRYEIGTLVECVESGVRLFVVGHSRDCDGSPLYDLAVDPEYRPLPSKFNESSFYRDDMDETSHQLAVIAYFMERGKCSSGWGEPSLRKVE